MHLLKLPLFRLLAINLVIGALIAVLMVVGLLVLNPLNIRHMIFSDHEPAAVAASRRKPPPWRLNLWRPRHADSASSAERAAVRDVASSHFNP